MKIRHAYFVAGTSAFYFDDQKAIKLGAVGDGFSYDGQVVTPGFQRVRQAGESVSVILELENGQLAYGDCAAVQYSGAGGRDPLFTAHDFIPMMERYLRPLLEGRDVSSFIDNARFFDLLEVNGQRLHTAIRYGVTQALLDATALACGVQKVEVLCDEYDLPIVSDPVPIFGQSGDDRFDAVDKMVLKGVDALPHALINNVEHKLGRQGEKLQEYVSWLVRRIKTLRQDTDYRPDLHIDVYGTVGQVFDLNPDRIAGYLAGLGELAGDFPLYIEGPVDAGAKDRQMEVLRAIKSSLERIGSNVRIVADEWCNTFQDVVDFVDADCCHTIQVKTPDLGGVHNSVEAVLYCNRQGVQAYQGGTCNETDISARCCVHLALASRPMRMLAKPGMGVDEGYTIVSNEMRRSLALLKRSVQVEKEIAYA